MSHKRFSEDSEYRKTVLISSHFGKLTLRTFDDFSLFAVQSSVFVAYEVITFSRFFHKMKNLWNALLIPLFWSHYCRQKNQNKWGRNCYKKIEVNYFLLTLWKLSLFQSNGCLKYISIKLKLNWNNLLKPCINQSR